MTGEKRQENGQTELSRSAARVQAALDALGLATQVVELPASTRTAGEAATAVGASVAQIAKSLVFQGRESDELLLVIASGPNRVDADRLAELAGEPVSLADPDVVRETTGYAIGGVPPMGHARPLRTWIDEDLLAQETIWAAAGTPRAVFALDPRDLPRLTGGAVTRIRAQAGPPTKQQGRQRL